jgi:copper chaperone CopZ
MTNYKVTNLTDKTPKPQQEKLEAQLKAIKGVETVQVNALKSQVSMTFRPKQEPTQDIIASAVTNAGFSLGARS